MILLLNILINIPILVILSVTNVFEDFSVESLCNPEYIYRNEISKVDCDKNFMLRDIKTKYWLIIDGGIGKFLPGRFGVPLVISDDPNEYLPLRVASNPNTYLLSDTNGSIRSVSNPYNKSFVIEILIYKERNILAWNDDVNNQYYIAVNNAGYMYSTNNPDEASQFEMLFV